MKKILLIIICLFIITGCGNENYKGSKTLTCLKDVSQDDVKMTETSNLNFKDGKLETMAITIVATIPDEYKSYMNTFMESCKKEYNELYKDNDHISYDVKQTGDLEITILVNVDYLNMTEKEKEDIGSDDFEINKKQLIDSGYDCK